jgi:hypothetical protein
MPQGQLVWTVHLLGDKYPGVLGFLHIDTVAGVAGASKSLSCARQVGFSHIGILALRCSDLLYWFYDGKKVLPIQGVRRLYCRLLPRSSLYNHTELGGTPADLGTKSKTLLKVLELWIFRLEELLELFQDSTGTSLRVLKP